MTVLPYGDHVVSGTGGDDEGGNALSHAVPPLRQVHQRRNDDRRRHGGQDEAEHEADGPGEAEDEVGEDGGGCRLHEAGDEGRLDHHAADHIG